MITVKVARLGNAVQEIALADGATVQDALTAADLELDNEEIRVGNETSALTTVLRNNSIVTLVPKVKGGQKLVKVARLGSSVVEVAVSDSAIVRDVLEAADIEVENEEVRVNGSSVSMDSEIGSATLITIVPKVKGGK